MFRLEMPKVNLAAVGWSQTSGVGTDEGRPIGHAIAVDVHLGGGASRSGNGKDAPSST